MITRIACGRMTSRRTWPWVSPVAVAASRCPLGTARIAGPHDVGDEGGCVKHEPEQDPGKLGCEAGAAFGPQADQLRVFEHHGVPGAGTSQISGRPDDQPGLQARTGFDTGQDAPLQSAWYTTTPMINPMTERLIQIGKPF